MSKISMALWLGYILKELMTEAPVAQNEIDKCGI